MNPWDEKAADVAELVALEASEWSPAVATRFGCFMSGARWQREALLADDMIERAARGIHASHDRGDWEHEPQAVQDEYLDMARAALTAALGIEGDE